MKKLTSILLAACLMCGALAMTACDVSEILDGVGLPNSDENNDLIATDNIVNADQEYNDDNGRNENADNRNENSGNHNGNGNGIGFDKNDSYLGKNPSQLYREKVTDVKKSTNYTVTVEAINRVAILGAEAATTEKVKVKLDDKKFSADIASSGNNSDYESEQKLWYVDGYLYSEMDAELVKEAIDEIDVAEQLAQLKAIYETYIFDLTEEYFDGVAFTVDEKGAHFSVALTAEEISALLCAATGVEQNVATENCTVDVTFDLDGNISGYVFELEGTMSQTAFGYTTEYDVYMLYNIKFSERGNTKVERPQNEDKFVEKGHGDR